MQAQTVSLRSLFDAARELDVAARAAYLDAHCASATLRGQVERLLAADAEDGDDGALGEDALALAGRLGDVAQELPGAGQRIGAWELLALLGEGGSSTVFRARRASDGVQQEAALKLLRRGVYTAQAQRQFRRERQALAQLRHPGIARLIEGGVTDVGLAYIALELVEGLPITDYARTRRLDVRQCLALFLDVCRAVEAAHRALIVHRDLKPGNVLVSAEGHVKLLDFGIAKLLDAEDETQTHLPAFTPAYAAPEQVAGAPATAATDVYALGVMLAELVTGQRISDGGGRTPSARITRDTDRAGLPAPPQALRRTLRGDLDNIVLKATEPDAERRYVSVTALADDVQRYLDGQPVAAAAPSAWYRTRKFVWRHRGGMAVTAVFVLALLAALGLALWQGQVARREAARANSVRDFLVSLFDAASAHLPREQRPTPEMLVMQAQRRLEAAPLDDVTRADVLRTLGEVDLSLANFARAEAAFARAQALAGARDPALLRQLAVLHADALQRAGRNAEASRDLDALLPALRAASDGTLARALGVHAAADLAQGRTDAAIALQREALAAGVASAGADSDAALNATLDLGDLYAAAQHWREAATTLDGALQRWRERGRPQDDRYVAALSQLAVASDALGDLSGAEARFRELLAAKQRIFTPPHNAIAVTLRDLGVILTREEHYAQAQPLLEQALAMDRQVFGADHREVAADHHAIGQFYAFQRRFAEGDAAYGEAIGVCERTGLKDEICPHTRNDRGMLLYREGRYAEARAAMTRALEERRALFGENHPTVAYSLSTLANVAVKLDDNAGSIALSTEALGILERLGQGATREAAMTRFGYAQALWQAHRYDEALAVIDRALTDWQREMPEGKAKRVAMLALKAQILRDGGHADAAKAAAQEAIALGVKGSELGEVTKALLREIGGRDDLYLDTPAEGR